MTQVNSIRPGCLASLLTRQRPLLVDQAEYQGEPAVVIVLPGQGGPARVLVEAATCTGAASRLLASTTLPG